jgi:hypothetical protein
MQGASADVVCGLFDFTIFSPLPQTAQFLEQYVIEHNMCVLIFSTNFV